MVTRATTFAVNNDEPSMLLKEFNKDGSRWQTVHVVRNDEIAEYTEKLGPTSLYEYGPINIIGGVPDTGEIIETVGSLRDIANDLRFYGNSEDAYDAEPGATSEQWVADYHEERERREQGNRIWSPVTKPLL